MTVTFGPDHIVFTGYELPATLGDPFEVYRWAMEIADYGRAKAS